MHRVTRLYKTDILKVVMHFEAGGGGGKLEWKNNPFIHRMKELRVRQGERKISSVCEWKQRTHNQHMTGTISAHTLRWLLNRRRSRHGNVLIAVTLPPEINQSINQNFILYTHFR